MIIMETQQEVDYQRIANAITYIRDHFKTQPSIEEVAAHIHVSPAHFQRMFASWAGTSPKKFLQYISVEHAKKLLREDRHISLFDATYDTGLSSTSRLHDLFIKIEGMTPAEYKNGGKKLLIRYSFTESPFGKLIIGSTEKGICFMGFTDHEDDGVAQLRQRFPHACLITGTDNMQQHAALIFQNDWSRLSEIKLHLKGTPFQLKVWETLLRIPMGQLATYGQLAKEIGNTKASRAVGTAIGSNPVAFLIPCHRVIQSSGTIGGYMWGPTRKTAIIGWESALQDTVTDS
ncbi:MULTISPECIES: methylated-DNA--[protein]-cysteine S-methyltransferase [unclassified Sphingobacterium]|uniref:methylated-DNA--[protein]-cysteine S-methyltransferase n=1 Tax=unclassified Sphingobacterium TaxID=2609468 RepID=UPI0025E635DA|nr:MULTISPECIES: methylated-DNA--[protein]-cysteine S-methyltransferase [unclassified Sphingobacterium]